ENWRCPGRSRNQGEGLWGASESNATVSVGSGYRSGSREQTHSTPNRESPLGKPCLVLSSFRTSCESRSCVECARCITWTAPNRTAGSKFLGRWTSHTNPLKRTSEKKRGTGRVPRLLKCVAADAKN